MIHLPTLNAVLNATSAFFLTIGYVLIRRQCVTAHKICMGTAFLVSVTFLGSYLYYHFHAGATPFRGEGWLRPVYFTLLISHTTLAVLIVPLVLLTLTRALRGRYEKHKAIARVTLPLWLYVSVTGVLVYLFLYHLALGVTATKAAEAWVVEPLALSAPRLTLDNGRCGPLKEAGAVQSSGVLSVGSSAFLSHLDRLPAEGVERSVKNRE